MKPLTYPPQEAIDRIRFEPERECFEALMGDKRIATVAETLRNSNEEEANRRKLLANSLRITDRIIPSLIERVELVKRITHLQSIDVETFIYNNPQHAASCVRFEDGTVFLLISSGLYSKLTERELLFVVGHEFGHVAYGHHDLPARAILAQRGACDAQTAIKLMAWSRRAEISADRVGLLCCQDFDSAAKAFIKLSSGLNEELGEFDLQGYISQVEDFEEVSRTVRVVEDCYSTHPFNPIRVVALSRFWNSQVLSEYVKHSRDTSNQESVDSRINELLAVMDADAETIRIRSVVDCLAWGGAWVAACDGRIDQSEIAAICRSVDSRVAGATIAAIQKSPQPLNLIRERFGQAAASCQGLAPQQRHAIMQRLIAVAKAHVSVAKEEMQVLHEICVALDVNPTFPERVLSQYATDAVFSQI